MGVNEQIRAHARQLAEKLGVPLVERAERSLNELRRMYQTEQVVVVTGKGARLEASGKQPLFFHPNTAAFRIKRLERGDTDIMLSVCQIQPGDHILDATLGLGADAIVFAHAAGTSGRVVGVESQPLIALLVEDGLRHWLSDSPALNAAMRRIEVVRQDHLTYLRQLPRKSFDVVYLDPMFAETVDASKGIEGIREYANVRSLQTEVIEEALQVARRRVVLKEGKTGKLHKQFGFTLYRKRAHQVIYSYREPIGGE